MENDFRIKKINAKEEVEFHKEAINAVILAELKGEDIDITSDSDTDDMRRRWTRNIVNLLPSFCER